jgi:hypothetical protein
MEQNNRPLLAAAQANLEAARTLSAATRELADTVRGGTTVGNLGMAGRRQEETTTAIASGMLLALRRAQQDAIIGGSVESIASRLPGVSYGRQGASLTGQGQRAQTYGAIGGAIGYAVAGPIGGFVGGMLGGLLGGNDSEPEKPPLERQWYNTPEGFEIESYLYNLKRMGANTSWRNADRPVHINNVNLHINGQGAQAGLEAGRAFAAFLGRQVALNSAVAMAAGYGME